MQLAPLSNALLRDASDGDVLLLLCCCKPRYTAYCRKGEALAAHAPSLLFVCCMSCLDAPLASGMPGTRDWQLPHKENKGGVSVKDGASVKPKRDITGTSRRRLGANGQ